MNWLAHVLISKKSIDYQLGNLLADPLKARLWDGANQQIHEGVKMHCAIDSFTDSNKIVSQSKARLNNKGLLRGVVIDIAYDYSLLQNWQQYCELSIDDFINQFYQSANKKIQSYPYHAKNFVERIIASKNLTSYSTLSGVKQALERIDQRLSDRVLQKEPASQYLPSLQQQIKNIQNDFSEFFPQLISFFKTQSGCSFEEHWLKN